VKNCQNFVKIGVQKGVIFEGFRGHFLGFGPVFRGFRGSAEGRQNRQKWSKMAKIGVLGMDWT
jgi:hypothetical protein